MRHSFLLSHVSYAILLLRSYRMTVINLFHDPLCPPHGIGNGATVAGTRAPLSYCASFRAARMLAAISSTRLRPSSMSAV